LNEKDDQHDRTDLSLKPARHAQTADNHEDSRNETEKRRPLGKQNARGLHRIRPAPDVAKATDQKTPAKNDPQNGFGHQY